METQEILDNMRADELKALAKTAGLPRTITRKPELVAELNRFVMNRLPECLQSLAASERHLLAEAAHNHGRVKPDVFVAKYGVRCPRPGYFHRKDDASLIYLLIARDRYTGEIRIPDAIVQPLQSLLQKPAAAAVSTLDAIPENLDADRGHGKPDVRTVHRFESERIALAELRRVLVWSRPAS